MADAILHLIQSYDIKPEDVEAVACRVNPIYQKILSHITPTTALEGKFSIQFAMAVALVDRKLGLAQDTDEKVNDPQVKSLMKRVTSCAHPNWVKGKDTIYNRADTVTVRLRNGEEYSYEVLTVKGDLKNPLTEEELLSKYRECARLALKDKEIERCIELVWKLEELEDVRELMQIVAG